VLVEVDLVGVVGQQRQPDVVGLGDGAADVAAVGVANLEILEEPADPALLHRHVSSCARSTLMCPLDAHGDRAPVSL